LLKDRSNNCFEAALDFLPTCIKNAVEKEKKSNSFFKKIFWQRPEGGSLRISLHLPRLQLYVQPSPVKDNRSTYNSMILHNNSYMAHGIRKKIFRWTFENELLNMEKNKEIISRYIIANIA
jgi:hypothetical protein